jgi:hypothetical protein
MLQSLKEYTRLIKEESDSTMKMLTLKSKEGFKRYSKLSMKLIKIRKKSKVKH